MLSGTARRPSRVSAILSRGERPENDRLIPFGNGAERGRLDIGRRSVVDLLRSVREGEARELAGVVDCAVEDTGDPDRDGVTIAGNDDGFGCDTTRRSRGSRMEYRGGGLRGGRGGVAFGSGTIVTLLRLRLRLGVCRPSFNDPEECRKLEAGLLVRLVRRSSRCVGRWNTRLRRLRPIRFAARSCIVMTEGSERMWGSKMI